jgi:outer membrane protein, multidrug efflux system
MPRNARSVPAGLPSELLLRRPDILRAEYRAAARQQDLQAAWKSLLPSFKLTADGSTASTKLRDLLDERKLVASLAEGLTQPIFRGGRLKAEVKIAEAERDELAAAYGSTALKAFQEVETALAAEAYLDRQIDALRQFAADSKEAEELALTNYVRGLTTMVTVLEAQRRSFDSRSALIRAENERLQNRIDLHLALGGDFTSAP